MNKIRTVRWQAPVGAMVLGSIGGEVCLCDWAEGRKRAVIDGRLSREFGAEFEEGPTPALECLIAQLDEYFTGIRREFDLPIRLAGTPFQLRVWAELMRIPYGATISYAELARRSGNPNGVRAVANANAVNAVSILVPCHRVIGSNRTLTGYSGGLTTKQALLDLESLTAGNMLPLDFHTKKD